MVEMDGIEFCWFCDLLGLVLVETLYRRLGLLCIQGLKGAVILCNTRMEVTTTVSGASVVGGLLGAFIPGWGRLGTDSRIEQRATEAGIVPLVLTGVL